MLPDPTILDSVLKLLANSTLPQVMSTVLSRDHSISDKLESELYEIHLETDGYISRRRISGGRIISQITDRGKLFLAGGGYSKHSKNSMTTLKKIITEHLSHQIMTGSIFQREAMQFDSSKAIDEFYPRYVEWDNKNKLILEHSFTQQFQQFFRMYPTDQYLGNIYVDKDSFEHRRNALQTNISKKKAALEQTLKQLPQLESNTLLPIDEVLEQSARSSEQSKQTTQIKMKKIFLSHSSKDREQVDLFKDLLETIGIHPTQIFYSSGSGYGIPLGENLFNYLRAELSQESLVIFLYSEEFFKSAVCMCEMGAAWILTKKHIPVIIPPFDYDKVKGVFPNDIGCKINDRDQLNVLKDQLEREFSLTPRSTSSWEQKRNKYLEEINKLLPPTTSSTSLVS